MEHSEKRSFEECITDYELAIADPAEIDQMTATITLLDGLTEACSTGGLVEKGVLAATREHWYTRAAAALTQVITHPGTRINAESVAKMILRKQIVSYIFCASGFRNMSHLISLIKDRSDNGDITINTKRAAVLLTFIGLDDVNDSLMDVALRQPPQLLLHLMLGWLNQRAVLTAQGEKNRGRLLTSGHLLEEARISDAEINSVANAWMYSSYADTANKHDIKKWFNHLLLKRMQEAKITPQPMAYVLKKRPKVLVIHERFVEQHAMFRCYAPMIRTLGDFFETVALADSETIDEAADKFFDKVIRLPAPRPSLAALVKLILNEKPDIIYYPSVGMSFWPVMTAGLRLAPIQIATGGHPATTMLNTIDYVYSNGDTEGDLSKIYSERIIKGPTNIMFQAHSDLPEELPNLIPPSSREVRIAVNSKVMKLSWRLITICIRLQREAKVPVRFSFFPGERLVFMDGLDAAIRAHLPSANVVPYVGYEKFLNEMCKCDFALAAFPFGNTNSTVDTCMLGLPTVAHFGPEIAAQSDRMVLRAAGLPDWLVCDNDEDYFQAALRLINEPSIRGDVMEGNDRQTVRQRLFSQSVGVAQEPFGEVLYKVHRNFALLGNSDKRVIDFTEILALDS